MPAKISCPTPGCNAVYRIPDEKLGRIGRCKKCGTNFPLVPPTIAGEPTPEGALPSIGSPSTQQDDLPAQFGRYKIIRSLGSGGMGSVWLAKDTELKRSVALKVPHRKYAQDPRARKRFLREARAAAMFHHRNFCPIYEVGEVDGRPYLTLPYYEGGTLSQLIQRGVPWESRRAAEVIRELAAALAKAHEKKIVHRDLKPSNLMLASDGTWIIMDFGLVQGIEEDENKSRISVDGNPLGTPEYMPPEQANGDLEAIGPHSDIYSLGVIFYELLTGRLPFTGNIFRLIDLIKTIEPPAPSLYNDQVDLRLESICLKAMAKKPGDRHATMEDFSHVLRAWLDAPAPKLNGIDGWPSIDRYRLKDRLRSRDYLGELWLAQDTNLRQDVELKVLEGKQSQDPQCRDALFREARIGAIFNHPNICQILDFCESEGSPYLTMRYYEGGSLSDQIQRAVPWEARRAVEGIRQLATGLAKVHRKGIVHRNFKPSNVMIDSENHWVITDFSMAFQIDSEDYELRANEDNGTICGTLLYMSPEQAKGDIEGIDLRSDIYILGVIFYELLTGHRPIEGTHFVLITKLLNEEPRLPSSHRPGLDPALESICLKAMAKRPEDRYASMDEFSLILQAWLDLSVPASPSLDVSTHSLDRYEKIQELGRGGMGVVWLARDTGLFNRPVAMKVLRGELTARPEIFPQIHLKVKSAALFDHPNFCPIFDRGELDGVPYIIMRFIEGKSLAASIDEGTGWRPRKAANIVRELAIALAEAHHRGCVHANIKPANIMLSSRDQLILMDLGLPSYYDDICYDVTFCGDFPVAAYNSPEQVQGIHAEIGPRSDIYSLGAVFYELLTGRHPFKEPNYSLLINMIKFAEPYPLRTYQPDLDPALESICLKAMAKRPEDRYASMDEFARALQAWLGEPSTLTRNDWE